MIPVVRQSVVFKDQGAFGNTGTTLSATITVGHGSLLWVPAGADHNHTISSITDGVNTYNAISDNPFDATNDAQLKGFWAGPVAGGTYTVTLNTTAGTDDRAFALFEMGGVIGPPDGHGSGQQSSTNAPAASGTNANQPVLLVALTNNVTGDSTPTAGGGFVDGGSGWTFAGAVPALARGESKLLTTTGSQTATFGSSTTSAYLTLMAMFDAAPEPQVLKPGPGVSPNRQTQFAQPPRAFSPPAAALSGSSALIFGQSGTLAGAGALAGTSALLFGQSGTLAQPASFAAIQPMGPGATPVTPNFFWQRPPAYTLSGGPIAGSAALLFAQSGTLSGTGALSGAAALTFGQTGAVSGAGALSGSISLVFNESGTLTGSGQLTGESDMLFGQSGVLTGTGALIGESDLIFSASGTLAQPGALSGVSAILFAQSGSIAATGSLIGEADLSITASQAPPPVVAPPPSQGGSAPGHTGRKKKRKDGPYMREGQVFGEEYPVSPHLQNVRGPKESRKSSRPETHDRAVIEALLKELL